MIGGLMFFYYSPLYWAGNARRARILIEQKSFGHFIRHCALFVLHCSFCYSFNLLALFAISSLCKLTYSQLGDVPHDRHAMS